MNAYVEAPDKENIWTTLGPEFSKDARKTAVIVRALYGLKLAEAAFWSQLTKCMESLGYQSCNADPDLWLKSEIRPEDGVKYYSYLLCFVEILCVHQNADNYISPSHLNWD